MRGSGIMRAVRLSSRSVLPPVVLGAAAVVVAQVAVEASGVDPAVLPAPLDVGRALVDDAGTLLRATRVTAVEVLLGLAGAALVGLATALAMHRWPLVRSALHPWLVASQAVPIPAVAPALALWLGYTLQTRAAVVALVAFFPVATSTFDALARADRDLLDLYRSFGASRPRVLRDVELPGALPAVFSGLRVAAAYSVVGAVLGEWVGASQGLGYLVLTASNDLRADLVFACVVCLAALGIALVGACTLVERALTPWRRP